MKNDFLTKVLLGVLAVSALASLFCLFQFVYKARAMRPLQPQLMAINAQSQMFNALFNEVAEYSKKNTALDAALQGNLLWKNKGGAAAGAQAKPATK